VYLSAENYEEARKASQAGIDLDAISFISYNSLGAALYALCKPEEAHEAIKCAVKVSDRHQYTLFMLSWLYGMMGNTAGAQEIYEELETRSKTEFISALSLAVAAYYANSCDEAYDFMEKAFDERASLLITMSGFPFLSFIRTDPRFQPFLQRMNYP
jgi:tetratricopeptide (TPR) repeat protein